MHSHYTELMSLALDHEASAEQMAALQAHLKVCADCAARWLRWQALDARLRAAPMLAAPPQFAERVLARLESRRRQSLWGGWLGVGLLTIWLAAAGVLALAVLGGAAWALAHPVQASMALAACAQLLSSALWPVRSVGIVLTSAGLAPQMGVAAYLGVTGALFGVWAWLAMRRRPLGLIRA